MGQGWDGNSHYFCNDYFYNDDKNNDYFCNGLAFELPLSYYRMKLDEQAC